MRTGIRSVNNARVAGQVCSLHACTAILAYDVREGNRASNDQKSGGGRVWEIELADARNVKTHTVTMNARYVRSAELAHLRHVSTARLAR
jgi:hypothetical protein